MQEVFVSLIRDPGQFRARARSPPGCTAATTHLCLQHASGISDNRARLLALRRRARLVHRRRRPGRGAGCAAAPGRASPTSWRAIAMYHYFDELTHEEIAELLGCSRRHVGKLLHAAGEAHPGAADAANSSVRAATPACRICASTSDPAGDLDGDAREQARAPRRGLRGLPRARRRVRVRARRDAVRPRRAPPLAGPAPAARPRGWAVGAGDRAPAAGAAVLVAGAAPGRPRRRARGKRAAAAPGLLRASTATPSGAAAPDESVSPGDLVRFVVSTPRPAHLAIAGPRRRGAASVYFPVAGVADTVDAGTDVAAAARHAARRHAGPGVRRGLLLRPAGRLTALRARPRSTPPGCSVDRLDWMKVRGP